MLRLAVVLSALLVLPGFSAAQNLETGLQQRTHTVVKGETLWHLAELYLGDPYRWPLIYETNQAEISDPHWIYPGQVFVITARPGAPAQVQAVTVVTPEGVSQVPPVETPARMPGQAGAAGSVLCPGPDSRTIFFHGDGGDRGCRLDTPSPSERTAFYGSPGSGQATTGLGATPARVTLAGEEGALTSVPRGTVYASEWLSAWDQEPDALGTLSGFSKVLVERTPGERAMGLEHIRVDLAEGVRLQVGDLLQAFRVAGGDEAMGMVLEPTGVLVVSEAQDGEAVALLSAEFRRVNLGDYVRMAPEFSLRPGVRARPVESNVAATILGFTEERAIQGFWASVFLDVGEAEGIAIGDRFSVYLGEGTEAWGEPVAELQVVLVRGATATAQLVNLRDPVLRRGLPVRLTAKMQ